MASGAPSAAYVCGCRRHRDLDAQTTATIYSQIATNWETRVELEIVAGRALAMCVHPLAALRSRSSKGRILVFIAYVVGSYGVVLGLLFAIT